MLSKGNPTRCGTSSPCPSISPLCGSTPIEGLRVCSRRCSTAASNRERLRHCCQDCHGGWPACQEAADPPPPSAPLQPFYQDCALAAVKTRYSRLFQHQPCLVACFVYFWPLYWRQDGVSASRMAIAGHIKSCGPWGGLLKDGGHGVPEFDLEY